MRTGRQGAGHWARHAWMLASVAAIAGCAVAIVPPAPAPDPGQPLATFWETTSIDFAKNSSVMDAAAQKAADALAVDIKTSKVQGITIKGRSDQDDPANAKSLTAARSSAVTAYLVQRGVAPALFTTGMRQADTSDLEAASAKMWKEMGQAAVVQTPGVDVAVAKAADVTQTEAPPPPPPPTL